MRTFEVTAPMGREPRIDDIRAAAAQALRLRENAVINVIDPTKPYQPVLSRARAHCHLVKRSIDARGDVIMRYQYEAYYYDEPYQEYKLPQYQDVHDAEPVIVIGSGPAGMFAALKLLTLGRKPIVLERGKEVHGRKKDIANLNRDGLVNPDTNYCYGEGGAGTFSDGKLLTRSSKRGDIREVLYQFVAFGADPSILVDAHPHIGTDKLPRVVENIRNCIIEHGGEYHFDTKMLDIIPEEGGDFSVLAHDSAANVDCTYSGKSIILATGHSSREVYDLFSRKGWALEPKGFAMGVRVEHPQSLINRSRYHGQWEIGMPAAEYSFVEQVALPDKDGNEVERGVFSFCMCPGGILVPSATEDGTIVMNGMSNSARNSKWANAGVVVSVEPGDEPEEYQKYGAFSLLEFQHDLEKKMYDYVASCRAKDSTINPMAAPAQRMIDFCDEVMSEDLPQTSYRPGVVSAPLHVLLPDFIVKRLQDAFAAVHGHTIRGYFTNDALLLGIESRTSSPIRITRDPETFQCTQVRNLYPCGEGAGYAGGIVSSAIDGINCAVAASEALDAEKEEKPQGNSSNEEGAHRE